jgi:hypothetical protein
MRRSPTRRTRRRTRTRTRTRVTTRTRTAGRRPLSEYNKFVQKEMKRLKGTPKSKMKKIGKLWRQSHY